MLPVAPMYLDTVCQPKDDPNETICSGGREVRLRTCTPTSMREGARAHGLRMMLTVFEPAQPHDPPNEVVKGLRVSATGHWVGPQ
jgi:hypothetical protein